MSGRAAVDRASLTPPPREYLRMTNADRFPLQIAFRNIDSSAAIQANYGDPRIWGLRVGIDF